MENYFTFTVKTEFTSGHRFDQCGIAMYLDSENWLKASVEYENDRIHHSRLFFPAWIFQSASGLHTTGSSPTNEIRPERELAEIENDPLPVGSLSAFL